MYNLLYTFVDTRTHTRYMIHANINTYLHTQVSTHIHTHIICI